MAEDNALYFAKSHSGLGIRSAFDPEETDSGDETDYQLTEDLREPKNRPKKSLTKVSPGNLESGNPSEVSQVRPVSASRGGLNTAARPCHYGANNIQHAKATHLFFAPGSDVGYPLCPLDHAREQEHLAVWRSKNPDTIVRPSEPIIPGHGALQIANQEKAMKDDVSALSTAFMVFHHGISPDAPEATFGQNSPFAGAGRSPGSLSPLPAETRTSEFKETALNAALERARAGKGGRKPSELAAIGAAEEERRDYSKGYVKGDDGRLTRFYKPLGKAAKGKRKPIAQGTYVQSKDLQPISTPYGEGNAPIDHVITAYHAAKDNGENVGSNKIVDAILKQHGAGVVTRSHLDSALQTMSTPRKKWSEVAPTLKPLPIGGVGAYSSYLTSLNQAQEDKPLEDEANDAEKWGYTTSRNSAFEDDL